MDTRMIGHIMAALAVGAALLSPAAAQTPPSPTEIAAYSGVLAAAHRGDAAEITRLVRAGADPNQRDAYGRTPLHVATFARHHAAMRALVAAGADPRALDSARYDAITIAAVADDPATMNVALEIGGDPKAITSVYDGTALIAAAHLGHDQVVRDLIAAGAPLDHVNTLGWTALMESVVLGQGGPRHVATAKALVASGARRDIADRDGVTPLEHARRRGYSDMVAIFE